MFDIREIKKSIPSYKEFGRMKESGCKRNYDTAAPVISPLTSFEWNLPTGKYYDYLKINMRPVESFTSKLECCFDKGSSECVRIYLARTAWTGKEVNNESI